MTIRLILALVTALSVSTSLRAQVTAVDYVGFTVSDMDRSVDFFTGVLSFEKTSDTELAGVAYERLQGVFGLRMRVVGLKLGDEHIELTEYLAPRGRPIPADSRSNDTWFQHIAVVVSDMDRAYRHLRAHKVEHASSGPQTLPDWNVNAAGIRAFYFRDPDGHHLEIIEFPADKGDPKWHRPGGRLFLGIDHTAIVTVDTDVSLKFYRDLLGMRVAGESENYGTEQEHLNNVFGARLRITALRSPRGLGIELLEYLAPSGGRPYPEDLRANDLAHWQTTLVAGRLDNTAAALRSARMALISPGIVETNGRELGFAQGLMARDPDGHSLRFVEEP